LIPWQVDGYEVVFTTRMGGVSEGPYASLNLGRKSGDEVEHVDENRRIACEAIGAHVENLALNHQVHSARVVQAAAGSRGVHADGLWTNEPHLPILAMSADCLPVAIARAGATEPAIAVLHVGWRGLLEGILGAGAEALGGGSLVAAVGPGIGPCCYEVGEEVAAPYRERFGADVLRGGRLDLWTSAERALHGVGVERVDRFDRCTACEPETFFSHRRDHGRTGRQGVIAYVSG
jgi:YfiH family protein